MKPKIKTERYKRGRVRGHICTVESGNQCFLLRSKLAYIFTGGEKTISDAVRKGVACWNLDDETLITMRAKGVRFAGVLVTDNGDIYLAHIDAFFDRARLVMDARCKPDRRYMPLGNFRRKAGRVRV